MAIRDDLGDRSRHHSESPYQGWSKSAEAPEIIIVFRETIITKPIAETPHSMLFDLVQDETEISTPDLTSTVEEAPKDANPSKKCVRRKSWWQEGATPF